MKAASRGASRDESKANSRCCCCWATSTSVRRMPGMRLPLVRSKILIGWNGWPRDFLRRNRGRNCWRSSNPFRAAHWTESFRCIPKETMLSEILPSLLAQRDLTDEQMECLVEEIVQGRCDE